MLIVPRSRRSTPVARRLAMSVLLAALVWLGARGAGPVPPLGPLLDPWRGTWGLAASANLPRHAEDTLPGLGADVRVLYDDRAVPTSTRPPSWTSCERSDTSRLGIASFNWTCRPGAAAAH